MRRRRSHGAGTPCACALMAALTSAASRFAETGIRKPATTEATAGIRNMNAWAIIKPDLLLISQASITNAMCGNRSVRACMICSRPVRCCISWITSTTSTADRNAGRTAVERIVRKISAAMTADAPMPSSEAERTQQHIGREDRDLPARPRWSAAGSRPAAHRTRCSAMPKRRHQIGEMSISARRADANWRVISRFTNTNDDRARPGR